jgi:hypothetical protein
VVTAGVFVPLYMRHTGGIRNAKLGVATGRVDVQKGHETFNVASVGEVLSRGDVVRTGPDGHARIDYPDGSLTRLDVNTDFEVRDVRVRAGGKTIKLKLDKGRVWDRVQKLTHPGDRYEVKTVTAVATARGTGFMNESPNGADCNLIVAEGVVGDMTNGGDAADVPAGDYRTDDGGAINSCHPTKAQIDFIRRSIEEDSDQFGFALVDVPGTPTTPPSQHPPSPSASNSGPRAIGTGKGTNPGCQPAAARSASRLPLALVIAFGILPFIGGRRRRRPATVSSPTWTEADVVPPNSIETD